MALQWTASPSSSRESLLKKTERVKVGSPVQDVRAPPATRGSGFQGLSWGVKTTKIPFVLICALKVVVIGPSSGNPTLRVMLFLCL